MSHLLRHQNQVGATTLPNDERYPSVTRDYSSSVPAVQDSPLVFITATEKSSNGRHDDAARMVVRSHVMNTYYRQKKSPVFDQLPRSAVSVSSLGPKPSGSVGKFRLELWNGKRRKESSRTHKVGKEEKTAYKLVSAKISLPTLQQIPDTTCPDPFGVAVLPLNYATQEIINHYRSEIPSSIHPMKFYKYHSQQNILSMAIEDEALLHAILAYSRIHKFCFQSSQEPDDLEKTKYAKGDPDVLYHQTKAMHLINDKINSNVVSDTMIATVLTLLLQHPWIGGLQESDIHFAGLSKMVNFRGGLTNLASSLAIPIAFHDLKRSMLKGSKPYFPLMSMPLLTCDISVPLPNQDSIFFHDPNSLDSFVGTEFGQILVDLYHFTDFVAYYRFRQREFGGREAGVFESWNKSLEHRLLSYSPINLRMEMQINVIFAEALRLACILWMSAGLWSFPVTTRLVASNAENLYSVLQRCDLALWQESHTDVLVWILAIELCCTPHQGPERALLLGKLKRLVSTKGIDSLGGLVRTLKGFIFMDGVHTMPLACVWRDLMRVGGDGEEMGAFAAELHECRRSY